MVGCPGLADPRPRSGSNAADQFRTSVSGRGDSMTWVTSRTSWFQKIVKPLLETWLNSRRRAEVFDCSLKRLSGFIRQIDKAHGESFPRLAADHFTVN